MNKNIITITLFVLTLILMFIGLFFKQELINLVPLNFISYKLPSVVPDVQKLKVEILQKGSGEEVKKGDTVTVQYKGILEDGTVFDSSYNRNEPFTFTIGQGQVIPGWEQGILGMKLNEKRKIVIPPYLAYGQQQVGPIPSNSTLIFEVELLNISKSNDELKNTESKSNNTKQENK